MALFIIGLGLCNQRDVTVRGLELIKQCDILYLESYTSLLQCTVSELEEFYGKKIIVADRNQSEQGSEEIVSLAKEKNVGFLVIGDPFSATTHTEVFRLAKEKSVEVTIVNNASVLTAIGITGLQLYKFGKTTSIPFLEDHPQLETPYHVVKENLSRGLHTLCLLDLKPGQDRFMSIDEALDILHIIELRLKQNVISEDMLVVGCARLGCEDMIVKSGPLSEVKKINFGKAPFCLIIPGKMHFAEEEIVDLFKITS